LGGDDFDKVILDYIADEFKKDNGVDLRKDPQALQRLRDAAEKAKIELSTSMEAESTCRLSPLKTVTTALGDEIDTSQIGIVDRRFD